MRNLALYILLASALSLVAIRAQGDPLPAKSGSVNLNKMIDRGRNGIAKAEEVRDKWCPTMQTAEKREMCVLWTNSVRGRLESELFGLELRQAADTLKDSDLKTSVLYFFSIKKHDADNARTTELANGFEEAFPKPDTPPGGASTR